MTTELKIELDGSAVYFPVAGAQVKLPAAELARMWIDRLQHPVIDPTAGLDAHDLFAVELPAIGAQWNGGTYAGVTVRNNRPMALIVLPGEESTIKWRAASGWAEKQGGELPSRVDGLVLYQNLREQFNKDGWYWTDTVHPGDADFAFLQDFAYGHQYNVHKGYAYRARAVRRVAI